MKNAFFSMILTIFAPTAWAHSHQSVSFIEPKDGATVPSTFKVKMGVKGMKIAKAGEQIENKSVGHHHVIVNKGAIAKGTVIPTDDHHKHFGQGQTETELTLPPGKHTLTLQFADGAHGSYGPEMSSTITVTVKP